MFVVRNVFRCKPGQAKVVVEKFKKSMSFEGMGKHRILVDHVANFWTVVLETEVEDLAAFEKQLSEYGQRPEVQEVMSGYLDLIDGGHREIFRVLD